MSTKSWLRWKAAFWEVQTSWFLLGWLLLNPPWERRLRLFGYGLMLPVVLSILLLRAFLKLSMPLTP